MRFLVLALVLACGPNPTDNRPSTIAPGHDDQEQVVAAPGEPPLGPLPPNVQPERYRVELIVVPDQHGFHGSVEIDVEVGAATRHVWLHGNRLSVREASIVAGGQTIAAEYEQVDDEGVAILRLADVLPPGDATIRIEYDAPFNRALRGLYRVDAGGESYAFTQFEATSARLCFPSFDEPAFKTPFDFALTVKREHVAAFNTPAAEETEVGEDMKRIRFETTQPMPTYLVAMAVGALEVVEGEDIPASQLRENPIPLRGIAVQGKGEQLAYALAHTGAQVLKLEEYFGAAYPYSKLDIVAVPDFGAGAMENVGLITFREQLLLLDDASPEWQRRAYHYVMAHELAHQWFGNLVTMPWWDDIWLNEAFATWMGYKIVQELNPEYRADLSLLDSVQYAMQTDSLTTARQIRQPIESSHDIRNAFDSITYRKGGGVLSMFEQWMTPEVFRNGIRAYMEQNAWGTATYEALLLALSETSGKDVTTPFSTFLFQPGLPFLNVGVTCEGDAGRVSIQQSRYLPVGSQGDSSQSWQLPVCMRWNDGDDTQTTCALVEEPQHTMELEGCPRWIHPNADGAGYFRFRLDADQLTKLRTDAWDDLNDREKMALADSLIAAFGNGTLPAAELYPMLEPLARSNVRQIASAPMDVVRFSARLVDDDGLARVRAFAKRLYQPQMRRLGWTPRRNENSETALLRASVIGHMASFVEDRAVRRQAVQRAHRYLGYGRGGDGELHPDAVDANLVETVLEVAVQDGDDAFFDHMIERVFASEDARVRSELLYAIASARRPEHATRARDLALDERLRVNEIRNVLVPQSRMRETRDDMWTWLTENFDALHARLEDGAARTPAIGSAFCSEEKATAVNAFFSSRIDSLPGGPRILANVLEEIRLCAAKVEAHQASARGFFR